MIPVHHNALLLQQIHSVWAVERTYSQISQQPTTVFELFYLAHSLALTFGVVIKWVGFVKAIWVQAISRNNYTFSNYSMALKSILDLNQVQLNNLSVPRMSGRVSILWQGFLLKLTMMSSLRNYYEQRHACQDMLIPSRKVVDCLNFCHNKFEVVMIDLLLESNCKVGMIDMLQGSHYKLLIFIASHKYLS